jgi:hypothetical protein
MNGSMNASLHASLLEANISQAGVAQVLASASNVAGAVVLSDMAVPRLGQGVGTALTLLANATLLNSVPSLMSLLSSAPLRMGGGSGSPTASILSEYQPFQRLRGVWAPP